eukprot:TRINITY_DN26325_c0_g1_i1.p3 TRINITY_DN26325_c0_g1~~TRINITY_DN26325_c0_g1_i1.p3  ORF type:complete len:103 (+),score=33.25 TRINITY_DN26325_c0_g1_i1:108-416(+)
MPHAFGIAAAAAAVHAAADLPPEDGPALPPVLPDQTLGVAAQLVMVCTSFCLGAAVSWFVLARPRKAKMRRLAQQPTSQRKSSPSAAASRNVSPAADPLVAE